MSLVLLDLLVLSILSVKNGIASTWRNDAKAVEANGYRQSIFDERKWNQSVTGLTPWLVLAFVSFACLALLWKLPEDRARMML